MAGKECVDCPVRDLQILNRLVVQKMAQKLPDEVREPLLEAKKQLRLAFRGFIGHVLRENEKSGDENNSGKSRSITLE